MSLYNFHRVLIAAAIAFDFVLTLWAIREYRAAEEGQGVMLLVAIGSSIISIGLVAYLVYFNRNLAMLRHGLTDPSRWTGGDGAD